MTDQLSELMFARNYHFGTIFGQCSNDS